MRLELGRQLSHYRLDAQIGNGGMGEVFRAFNLRLECDVAVKVIGERVLTDETARRRFRREALALSKLNHPNVAVVHDFDTVDGVDFLVMEYVPGVTLSDLPRAGALPESEVVRLGIQIAAGVQAAHAQGIVHRDLKPGNLRITPDGRVKILDFGLAKLIHPSLDTSATESQLSATTAGAGTLAYMAPEQLRGGGVDARSDIYSIGVILYELATGHRPFEAKLATALVDDILHRPLTLPGRLHPSLSPPFEQIILKAMERDPRLRYQSAAELGVDLLRLEAPTTPVIVSRLRAVRRFAPRALLLVGLAALAATLAWLARGRGGTRVESTAMSAIVAWPGDQEGSRISPDGQWVSFLDNRDGHQRLWLQRLGGGEPQLLELPSGNLLGHVWSPDGQEIACLVFNGTDVLLQVLPAFGGPPTKSLKVGPKFMDGSLVRWIGAHVYIECEGLWRLDLASDQIEPLIEARGTAVRRDQFDVSQDEKRIVFRALDASGRHVWVADLHGQGAEAVTSGDQTDFQPRWLGPRCESIVYSSHGTAASELWRLGLGDRTRTRLTFNSRAAFVEDAAVDGSLVTFRENADRANLWRLDPRHEGSQQQLTGEQFEIFWPSVGGPGLVAFQKSKSLPGRAPHIFDSQIFLARLESGRVYDAHSIAPEGGAAMLSPQGRWLAYVRSTPPRARELWVVDPSDEHSWRVCSRVSVPWLYDLPLDWVETKATWSPDGEALYFVAAPPGGREIRSIQPSRGDTVSTRIAVASEPADFADLQISPDGTRLAYVRSNRTPDTSEVVLHDLTHDQERVLLSYTHPLPGHLMLRGWLRAEGPLVVLRTTLNANFTERAEILEVPLQGAPRQLGQVDNVFAGTARLDPVARTLYLTTLGGDGAAHNLAAFGLVDHTFRRLTDNRLPGISFSGLTVLPGGELLFSQTEKNEDVWLIRFAR